MRSKKAVPSIRVSLLVIAATLIVAATLIYLRRTRLPVTPAAQETSTPSPKSSSQPAIQPSPTPSPTATATPSPTDVTPTTTTLPESAQTFLAKFYDAYKQKDRSRLATYFTPDTTTEQKSLHSELFQGVDLSGSPGGPTLFATSAASQSVKSYTIVSSTLQGKNWIITVQEQRLSASGEDGGMATTLVTLVPTSGGGWLIDEYVHTGSAGKYDGFLIQ